MDPLKRAATSIPLPLNLAEAAGRTGNADAARTYARGSAMECAAILDALRTLEIIDADRHRHGLELLERIVAMLTRLCR